MKTRVQSPRVININDLRQLAKHRLPKAVFDYVDGGADGEITLRDNCNSFQDVRFNPKQAISFAECDQRICVVGTNLTLPFLLAPVGYSRIMHPGGEIAAARAAGMAGTGYILSTVSGHRLEDVKAASPGPVWYQLYLLGGRESAEAAIERARKAGFGVLVITVDTAVAGMRERDVRNGIKELLADSVLRKLPFLPQVLARPRWLISFLRDGGLPKLENIVLSEAGPMELVDVSAALAKAVVTWEDLSWIRAVWSGPIVVKGILSADDARRAVDEGAAAIVVSNHGGRQLDCAPATIRALPQVAAAVGRRTEVLTDGGIRRGSDIVKAMCMGARAVLVGRAYAYGLAARGEAGVSRALNILREGVERTLRLLGCRSVLELDSSYVTYPSEWHSK